MDVPDRLSSQESVSSQASGDAFDEDEENDLAYYNDDWAGDDNYATEGMDEEEEDPESYNFTCLTSEECLNFLEGLVMAGSARMQVSPDHMWTVLNKNKWSLDSLVEEYTSCPQKMLVDARVLPDRKLLQRPSSEPECAVCLAPMNDSVKFKTECGHRYCSSCWEEYASAQLANGVAADMECMGCSTIISRSMALDIVKNSPKLQSKYMLFSLTNFVLHHPLLRWCPGADCMTVVSVKEALAKRVSCTSCKSLFCFKCGLQYHAPTDCRYMKDWLKKCEDDSETMNYITANTKPCPKCGISIEKNGGCNHMQCSGCHYDFCWMCTQSWSTHSGEYYSCSKYTANSAKEAAALTAKEALKRYCHYFERWANHEKSLRLEEETLRKINTHMEDMVACQEGTWIDWQYLLDGAAVLAKSRYTLQYTYPYAYYNTDELFEYQQAQLEREIEALSFAIEHSSFSDRGTIQLKMSQVERWRITLLRKFLTA